MRHLYKFFWVTLIFLYSCKGQETLISPEASGYLSEVLTLMKNNSVNKQKIDWIDFKGKVFNHAKNAKTIEDTYPSVHYAIQLLGDSHSYFSPVNSNGAEEGVEPPVLQDEVVPVNIGYLRMGYCMGTYEQKQDYISKIQNNITARDSENLKGWIIDLRGNFGGDMSPMLIAASPFLGNATVGYTAYPDGNEVSWSLEKGDLFYDGVPHEEKFQQLNPALLEREPYIAVLTDTLTASSGEALAIAFKDRAKTRSFGNPTYGVSTSNEGFTLSDGSRMLMTVAVFCDRNKTKYGGQVTPDENIDPKKALKRAVKWLQSQK